MKIILLSEVNQASRNKKELAPRVTARKSGIGRKSGIRDPGTHYFQADIGPIATSTDDSHSMALVAVPDRLGFVPAGEIALVGVRVIGNYDKRHRGLAARPWR